MIGQLTAIEKYIAADRIFAYEFFAKGGKKILIDYVKECDKASDTKKWFKLIDIYKALNERNIIKMCFFFAFKESSLSPVQNTSLVDQKLVAYFLGYVRHRFANNQTGMRIKNRLNPILKTI